MVVVLATRMGIMGMQGYSRLKFLMLNLVNQAQPLGGEEAQGHQAKQGPTPYKKEFGISKKRIGEVAHTVYGT